MGKERSRHPESQISFLAPTDAVMIHLLRRFIAEASRLYEVKTGKAISDALEIRSPRDAYDFLRLEMEDLDQEQLRIITLNTKNRIISSRMIYQGTVNMTSVRIAEVFRPAIMDNASALVICHNHPSGQANPPSPEDIELTREVVHAGQLLGIDVLDHIVIGKGNFVSLKERGLGFGR